LSIVGKGNYEALIIQDGTDADYRTNKESSVSTIRTVNNTQTIEVKLAPGGGACILLQLKGTQ
jgi:alpha-glucosidase